MCSSDSESGSACRSLAPFSPAEGLHDHVGRRLAPRKHPAAAILFANIVGFTTMASTTDPSTLVQYLDSFFGQVDEVCEEHHVEKIKTIGVWCGAGGGGGAVCAWGWSRRRSARCVSWGGVPRATIWGPLAHSKITRTSKPYWEDLKGTTILRASDRGLFAVDFIHKRAQCTRGAQPSPGCGGGGGGGGRGRGQGFAFIFSAGRGVPPQTLSPPALPSKCFSNGGK